MNYMNHHENYNRMVAREIDRSIRNYIQSVPQPTIINRTLLTGGVPLRPNPLPGRIVDYPRTLATDGPGVRGGVPSGGRRRGRFTFRDFTNGVANVGRQAARALAPLAPIAKEVGISLAKDAIKGAVLGAGRRGKKKSKVDDIVKIAVPEEVLSLGGGRRLHRRKRESHAHEGTYPNNVRASCVGGATPKGGKHARGAIVAKVMKEKGLKLAAASKYVKEHGLY